MEVVRHAAPPQTGAADRATAPPDFRYWQPPPAGRVVTWQSLPVQIKSILRQDGIASPDGRWLAARIAGYGAAQGPQLWIAAADGSAARVVEDDFFGYWAGLWRDAGRFLFRRERDDSWREVEAATGAVHPFLPALLTGRHARVDALSTDGRRLLYTTDLCFCNRPGFQPATTYVANTDGSGVTRVGVDVVAHFAGDQVVAVPFAPVFSRVAAGPPPTEQTAQGYASLLQVPAILRADVAAAVAVQWRAWAADAAEGAPPLAVLQARQVSPGQWQAEWADPPAGLLRLVPYAEPRPAVPDDPQMLHEGDWRWVTGPPQLALRRP